MDTVLDIIDNAVEALDRVVKTLPKVGADKIGLDYRAGAVYVDTNSGCIIVHGRVNALEYYGGFEYVDRDAVFALGQYTVYTADDDRVRTALDVYEGVDEDDEEEG